MFAKVKTTPNRSFGWKNHIVSITTNKLKQVLQKNSTLSYFATDNEVTAVSVLLADSQNRIQSGHKHDEHERKSKMLSWLKPFFIGLDTNVFKNYDQLRLACLNHRPNVFLCDMQNDELAFVGLYGWNLTLKYRSQGMSSLLNPPKMPSFVLLHHLPVCMNGQQAASKSKEWQQTQKYFFKVKVKTTQNNIHFNRSKIRDNNYSNEWLWTFASMTTFFYIKRHIFVGVRNRWHKQEQHRSSQNVAVPEQQSSQSW